MLDLEPIRKFCRTRGELIYEWITAMEKFERENAGFIDEKKANELLARVLDRVKHGEFIMTSEETFAAPFDPRFIIPGLSGISQEIEGSNRPKPRFNNPIEAGFGRDVGWLDGDIFPRWLFMRTIERVAKEYIKLYPKREAHAEAWLADLKKAYSSKYSRLSIVLTSVKETKEGKKLRWNCKVLMEMVRTGEELPSVKAMLETVLSSPANVNGSASCFVHSSSSHSGPVQAGPSHSGVHSLGRISIRNARRIGYAGRRMARDGGIEF